MSKTGDRQDGTGNSAMTITPNFLQDRSQNLNQSFAIRATAYGHRVELEGERQ